MSKIKGLGGCLTIVSNFFECFKEGHLTPTCIMLKMGEVKEVKCADCGKSFSSEQAKNNHMNAKHLTQSVISPHPPKGLQLPVSFKTLAVIALFGFLLLGGMAYFNAAKNATSNAVAGLNPGENGVIGLQIGNTAPDISFVTLQGETKKLSDFSREGKPVVIEFGTTWCPHCKNDLQTLKEVLPDYEKDVAYVFLDMDRSSLHALQEWWTQNSYQGMLAVPENNAMKQYNASYTTTKFGINKTGNIAFTAIGEEPDFVWREKFKSLLQ